MSSLNFWFDHIIDAYLEACAKGQDWHAACAEAEKQQGNRPRRVLTQQALRTEKGIRFSGQHIARKVDDNTFPPPFKLAEVPSKAPPASRKGGASRTNLHSDPANRHAAALAPTFANRVATKAPAGSWEGNAGRGNPKRNTRDASISEIFPSPQDGNRPTPW